MVRPRIAHYPDAAYSSGPAFCELADSVGVHLFPWQRWTLEKGLGERPDGKWASFQNTLVVPRQNGKDEVFMALGLGWLFLTGEKLIGHSAHEYKTAMEAFRRLVTVVTNADALRRKVRKIVNTNGEEGIELITGQRIRFLARSKGAGRGFSFDKMIWNEAYALTAAQVDAVLPTMSARPNPQLWLGSSPPLDTATGEALFRARKNAGIPGTTYLEWGHDSTLTQITGCRDDDCTHRPTEKGCVLDKVKVWAATNPSHPYLINDEAIQRERATMDPVGFARERLGVWPQDVADGYAVIDKTRWERLAVSPDGIAAVGRPVFAVAVSSRRFGPVRAAVGVAQQTQDGPILLELVVSGTGTAWIPGTLDQLKARHPEALFVIDPGSPAGSVIPDVEAQGIIVEKTTTRDVASAFGMIYDAATEDGSARKVIHLGQSEITMALHGAGRRSIGDGHAWDRKNASTDITPLEGITLAYWGLSTHGAFPTVTVTPWMEYA